jgi:hypothetical protein
LYAIQSNRDNQPPLSGSVVVDATQSYDQVGSPAVSMQMNGKGARKWEEMTGNAYRDKSNIAIVLDEIVYSAPGVSKGAISGGRSEISGEFTLNEAIDLANVLGIIVELDTLEPKFLSILLNLLMLLSNIFTDAPRPNAACAAYSPTAPAPIITTLVG